MTPKLQLPFKPQHRLASSEVARQEAIGDAKSAVTRLKNFFLGTSIVIALSFTYLYITDTRASVHEWVAVPLIRRTFADAEDAHEAGNRLLKGLHTFGLHPRERGHVDAKGDLKVEVFGHVLDNPIATSAGIDKGAEIPDPLLALGPGIVEVGGATPLPQDGNAKPRVWRIPSQNALINRYGLNSEGADHMAMRLRQRVREFAYSIGLGLDAEAERKVLDGEAGVPPGSLTPGRLLAVQCAKMKTTPEADIEAVANDYVYCVNQLGKYADIIVVNVSSPNTPGLRTLQATLPLTAILTSVVGAAQATDRKTKPAVMVKVSPDEDSEEEVRGICDAIWMSGVDGVIVGNTTKKRPDPFPVGYALPSHEEKIMLEQGGYSGPQLFERTVALVKKYRIRLEQGPPSPPKESQGTQDAQGAIKKPVTEKTPVKDTKSVSPQAKPATKQSSSQPLGQGSNGDKLQGLNADTTVPALLKATESESNISSKSDDKADITKGAIQDSIERDSKRLKPLTSEADAKSKQPMLKLPERHELGATPSHELQAAEPALSSSTHLEQGSNSSKSTTQSPQPATSSKAQSVASFKEKVIFATGGITNGKQALEVLNAGASVAMVYTALVYGGAGTISRIKSEMREEIGKQGK